MLAPVGSAGTAEVGITLGWHTLPHCLGEDCCPPVSRAWQFSARLPGRQSGIGNAPWGNKPNLFATGLAQECGRLAATGRFPARTQNPATRTPALGIQAPAPCSCCFSLS